MRDIWTMILANAFVLLSLTVLLSAASNPLPTGWRLNNDRQRVSDLGLRFVFKR